VQGASAGEELARAIAELDEWGGCDLMIVGRGGGSFEDLWAFNEEVVSRAIYASRTPVVSAVGHEIDQTIADFVADARAATPSVAGELAVPERHVLSEALDELAERLVLGVRRCLHRPRERVRLLSSSIAFRDPLAFYRRRSQDVDRLRDRLDAGVSRRLERERLVLERAGGRLAALSPRAILARGYALVTSRKGEIVRRADQVAPGDSVDVRLSEGQLACTVKKTRSSGGGGES
jgi:exodeoxyribonuclease VII large subunit